MDVKHVIVGTAGHIDHGKSSLVEALTGTNPDRLEEEKLRGITIDIGFAFLSLDGAQLGFVDVPGHERFVRNMLAGAGGIDLVLLVVAADESIKPQTREHFDICRMLGVRRGIVVITKSDLADPDALGLVQLEIEEFVRGSFLEGAPILPVSARTGAGLDTLKVELAKAALSESTKNSGGRLRLPIDRSFAMKGFGTVVTGTLISGTLRVEDEVQLYPDGRRLRIRGLHSGGKSVARALAGQRTAVNLPGISHAEIRRGMTLGPAGIFIPTDRIDVRIDLLASARPLKNRSRVHFHQGTAETIAEVILLLNSELAPGQSAFAQLRLKEEFLLLPGDRFILRQFSPVVTIGGGIALDIKVPRHRRRDATVAAHLATLEQGTYEQRLEAMLADTTGSLSVEEVIARTGWIESEITAAAKTLTKNGKLRNIAGEPSILASPEAMKKYTSSLKAAVEAFHRENPLLPGIPKQDLRRRGGNPRAEIFEATLDDLVKAAAVSVSGDLVSLAGRTIGLTPEEARAKELIEQEFEHAGLTVPNLASVLAKLPVEPARARKILQLLLREKVLIQITGDLVFHRDAVVGLRGLLSRYRKERGERLPIAAFKELTGVTRKYAIPLLEYLDRERVTRRAGDERVIMGI